MVLILFMDKKGNVEFFDHLRPYLKRDSVNYAKTILVCDEIELRKRFDTKEKQRKLIGTERQFQEVYSKTISRTVHFSQDVSSLIPALIDTSRIQSFVSGNDLIKDADNLEFVVRCVRAMNMQNLREVFFFLENLMIALDHIETENWDDIFESLCINTLYDSVRVRNRMIEKSDIDDVESNDWRDALINSPNDEESIQGQINKAVSILGGYNHDLFFTKNIVFYGIVEKGLVKRCVRSYLVSNKIDTIQAKVVNRLKNYIAYTDDSRLVHDVNEAVSFGEKGILTMRQFRDFFITAVLLVEDGLNFNKFSTHQDVCKLFQKILWETPTDEARDSLLPKMLEYFQLPHVINEKDAYKELFEQWEERMFTIKVTTYETSLEGALSNLLSMGEVHRGESLLRMLEVKDALEKISAKFVSEVPFRNHFISSLHSVHLAEKSDLFKGHKLDELHDLIKNKSDKKSKIDKIGLSRLSSAIKQLKDDLFIK